MPDPDRAFTEAKFFLCNDMAMRTCTVSVRARNESFRRRIVPDRRMRGDGPLRAHALLQPLEQSQRVAARFGVELVAHAIGESAEGA